MFEVDVYWLHEGRAVEKAADRDLNALNPSLQLEDFYGIGINGFVGFEYVNNVLAVVLVPDKQEPLYILRLAAWLDDIRGRIGFDVRDRRVKVGELLKWNYGYAMPLQFVLPECTVVFQFVRVGRSANDMFAGVTQSLGMLALAKHIVKNYYIGPIDMAFPVIHFWHEAVGDRTLRLVADVILYVPAFFMNLPGDIADQAIKGYEQKFLSGFHNKILPSRVADSVRNQKHVAPPQTRRRHVEWLSLSAKPADQTCSTERNQSKQENSR